MSKRKGGGRSDASSKRRADRDALRRWFREERAPALIHHAGLALPPLPRSSGRPRHSDTLAYFGTEKTLAVVAWPDDEAPMTRTPAVHGVHHAGARDLCIFVAKDVRSRPGRRAVHPPEALTPFLPWLGAGRVRLFAFDEADRVDEVAIAKAVSLPALRDEVTWADEAVDEERRAWVRPLEESAADSGLSPKHRSSYLAWHVDGRMVLRVLARGGELTVTAGVNYSEPNGKDRPFPHEIALKGLITPEQVRELLAIANEAARARTSGRDEDNREHKLQARLEEQPTLIGLREPLLREFPSRRAGTRAFIDFLGVDADGRLHIVETKVGTDPEVVLQGLEYWAWTRANQPDVAKRLHADAEQPPVIDFVVEPKRSDGPLFDTYSRSLTRFLDEEVQWRLHRASWSKGDLKVEQQCV